MIPKFRFYYLKLNKIYEAISIDYLNEQVDCILPEMNGDISNWDWNVGVLMQYTGLKDKNGVEIFEGDVVSCFKEGLSVIEYHHGGFGLTCNGYFESFINAFGEVEVLGNQYEHPHLLEGDNE